MRIASRLATLAWAVAAAAVAALALWRASAVGSGRSPAVATGAVLLALVLLLALYGVRRRLPSLPLGRASTWLAVHVIGGLAGVGAYVVHAGAAWPSGAADQALAVLFLVVVVSGVVGHLLQAIVPRRLTRAGSEIIYERIPAEIARLRAQAESTILDAAAACGHDTLGNYYAQSLAWYFDKPRFALQHLLGTAAAQVWEARKLAAVERLLDAQERTHLASIAKLCSAKRAIDVQYALQTLLRRWLLIHAPAASAFMVMAAWHSVAALVYSR
ncbi:MAG: hypothetical protein ACO3YN_03860 [Rubrivivax sp.]